MVEITQDKIYRRDWLKSIGVNPSHVSIDADFTETTDAEGVVSVTFDALKLNEFGRGTIDPARLAFEQESRTVVGVTSFGEWLANREADAEHWAALAELDVAEVGELKGAALDEALEAAGLSKSGTADERRARLAEAAAVAQAGTLGQIADDDATLGDLAGEADASTEAGQDAPAG